MKEFADLQKRPEKAPEQPIQKSPQNKTEPKPSKTGGSGAGSYGNGVLRSFDLHELATSDPSQDEGKTQRSGFSGQEDTRIAQGFVGENGVQWDPVSEVFKVIVGGAIVGFKKTIDAANDLYHHVMKSKDDGNKQEQAPKEGDNRHGGGKNAQHGKAKPQPSKQQQLKDAEAKLEELKRTQGPKKEKIKAERTIDNLRKEIAKDQKGEFHSGKAKGSHGQTKR